MAINIAFNQKESTTMNKLYKIACMMLTGIALLATTSCSDPDDEITTANLDRPLRPAELELKVYDKINIKASMDFVTVPDYVDVVVEINDNPLSETKAFKPYRNYTINAKETTTHTTHVTATTNITDLTYFKDYRVTFTARDASGKTSKGSTAVATTDGIFKDTNDNDRTNNSLAVKWPAEVKVSKVRAMKMNNGVEELIGEKNIDTAAQEAGRFVYPGLEANTEYVFYIFNGDDCLGRTSDTTFPNYQELKAGNNIDFAAAIANLADGEALLLSPADDGTNEFTFSSEDGTASSKTLVLGSKPLRIFGRTTKPVIINSMSFDLGTADEAAGGLTVENVKFIEPKKGNALLKFTNATGEYKFIGVEVEGYKNFAQDPGGSSVCEVNLLEVKNCFMHDGISGRWMDFQKKLTWIKKIDLQQNTFAEICNGQDFLRYDYYAEKMPDIKIANNSFYKVNASSKGIVYVRSGAADTQEFKAEISKNVFESCKNDTYFSEDAKTNGLSFSKNYYKDSDKLLEPFSAGQTAYDPSPQSYIGKSAFKDPDNKDFTITNLTILNAGAGNTDFTKKSE